MARDEDAADLVDGQADPEAPTEVTATDMNDLIRNRGKRPEPAPAATDMNDLIRNGRRTR